MTVDQYKALANRSYATDASGGTIEFASDVSSADTSGVTFANGITYVLSSGDNTVSLGDSGITLKTQGSGTNTITLGSGADVLTLASTGKQTVSGTLTSGDTISATTAATFSGSSATFDVAAGGEVSLASTTSADTTTNTLTLGAGGSSSTPLYNGNLAALGTINSVTVGDEDTTDSTYMTLTASYDGEISAAGALYVTASGSSAIKLGTINGSDKNYADSTGGLKGATVGFTASANGDSVLIDASSKATVVGGAGADTFMFKSGVAAGSTATFDVTLGSGADNAYLSWGETLAGKVIVNLKDFSFTGESKDSTNVALSSLESLTKADALTLLTSAFSGSSDTTITSSSTIKAYDMALGGEVTSSTGTARLFSVGTDAYAIVGNESSKADGNFDNGEIVIKLTGAVPSGTAASTLVNNVRGALFGDLGSASSAAIETTGSGESAVSILKFAATEKDVTVTMGNSGALTSIQVDNSTVSSFKDYDNNAFSGAINGIDFTGVATGENAKITLNMTSGGTFSEGLTTSTADANIMISGGSADVSLGAITAGTDEDPLAIASITLQSTEGFIVPESVAAKSIGKFDAGSYRTSAAEGGVGIVGANSTQDNISSFDGFSSVQIGEFIGTGAIDKVKLNIASGGSVELGAGDDTLDLSESTSGGVTVKISSDSGSDTITSFHGANNDKIVITGSGSTTATPSATEWKAADTVSADSIIVKVNSTDSALEASGVTGLFTSAGAAAAAAVGDTPASEGSMKIGSSGLTFYFVSIASGGSSANIFKIVDGGEMGTLADAEVTLIGAMTNSTGIDSTDFSGNFTAE